MSKRGKKKRVGCRLRCFYFVGEVGGAVFNSINNFTQIVCLYCQSWNSISRAALGAYVFVVVVFSELKTKKVLHVLTTWFTALLIRKSTRRMCLPTQFSSSALYNSCRFFEKKKMFRQVNINRKKFNKVIPGIRREKEWNSWEIINNRNECARVGSDIFWVWFFLHSYKEDRFLYYTNHTHSILSSTAAMMRKMGK